MRAFPQMSRVPELALVEDLDRDVDMRDAQANPEGLPILAGTPESADGADATAGALLLARIRAQGFAPVGAHANQD